MRTLAAIVAVSLGLIATMRAETITVQLQAMLCESCVHEIESAFTRQSEVAAVHVDLAHRQVKIETKRGQTMSDLKIVELLKRSGYVTGKITHVT